MSPLPVPLFDPDFGRDRCSGRCDRPDPLPRGKRVNALPRQPRSPRDEPRGKTGGVEGMGGNGEEEGKEDCPRIVRVFGQRGRGEGEVTLRHSRLLSEVESVKVEVSFYERRDKGQWKRSFRRRDNSPSPSLVKPPHSQPPKDTGGTVNIPLWEDGAYGSAPAHNRSFRDLPTTKPSFPTLNKSCSYPKTSSSWVCSRPKTITSLTFTLGDCRLSRTHLPGSSPLTSLTPATNQRGV